MNVTDRAFIKAYAWDRPEAAPPAPHLVFVPVVGVGSPASPSAPAGSLDETSATSPTTARDKLPPRHAERAGTFSSNSVGKPAAVTHFVPPPHLSLGNEFVPRTSQRQPLPNPVPGEGAPPRTLAAAAKQPLSSFVSETTPVETFEPALGVPAFQWPETCEILDHCVPPDYASLVSGLHGLLGKPAPVVAVSGTRRGEGRSTTLLCVGRELARAGLRVVMVDGDFARPALGELLGLETTSGWEVVLTGDLQLSEAVVYSEAEQLSLLPMGQTPRDRHAMASALRVTISLAVLSQHYDVVLVDVGPLCDEPSAAVTMLRRAKFTCALLVHDARGTRESGPRPAIARLKELHVPLWGVVENFGANDLPHQRSAAA